jgi:hypothetical protein
MQACVCTRAFVRMSIPHHVCAGQEQERPVKRARVEGGGNDATAAPSRTGLLDALRDAEARRKLVEQVSPLVLLLVFRACFEVLYNPHGTST